MFKCLHFFVNLALMEFGFIFHRQCPDYTLAVAGPILESPKSFPEPRYAISMGDTSTNLNCLHWSSSVLSVLIDISSCVSLGNP